MNISNNRTPFSPREFSQSTSVKSLDKQSQPVGKKELSDDEKKQVTELKKRDAEVRAHEMAHMSAGGQHVNGGISFEYQTGPDGKRYAVGGEVSIDTSPVPDDPEATIQKMIVVRKAALAPANPSAQDRSVAANASRAIAEARMDLSKEKRGIGIADGKSENAGTKTGAGSRGFGYTNSGTYDAFSPTSDTTISLLA